MTAQEIWHDSYHVTAAVYLAGSGCALSCSVVKYHVNLVRGLRFKNSSDGATPVTE